MGKSPAKPKGKKADLPPPPEPEPEPEPEEVPEKEDVQFTDTSYTSASFESIQIVIVEEPKKEKKKKKKKQEEEVEEIIPIDPFVWSEDSLPFIEEEKVEEEEEKKPKPKAKGKKGKKEKAKEEIPEFEKPKNWKKMQKKERDAWLAQQIEEWRIAQEAERQALLAGIKDRRIQEARDRAKLVATDQAEQEIRRDILQKTVNLFARYEKLKVNNDIKKRNQAEWQQYLRCDGLPDARVVTQMNTYLHIWKSEGKCDDNELDRRCIEALPMLEMLDEFVANPRQYTPLQVQGFNEIRTGLRACLAEAIQCASYFLLRNLEKNLKHESVRLAIYDREFKGLRLNLWVAKKMPTRLPKPVEPEREPVDLSFPAIKVSVKLPASVDASCVCVRAARTLLDLLSESSRSFARAVELQDRYTDLFVFNVKELIETLKVKQQQDEVRSKFYGEMNAKIRAIEQIIKINPYAKTKDQEDEMDNLTMAEPPLMPDPRLFVGMENEKAFQKFLKQCNTHTRAGEVHLRKYRIVGGVLDLDLLRTPPQPKPMRGEVEVTTLILPKRLQAMEYQVRYRAPPPPVEGVMRTPSEIEEEMKKVEAEYQRLALVFIELPQEVLWQEPPLVCQWQQDRKLWTTNYVNDYKFNEDKLTVQFRTGVLWPIGLATLKYGNMPYQTWDIKPDPNGSGVIITVTGVFVTVTWLCLGSYVRLQFVTNASTPALKPYYNKPYTVKRMVQIMREAGCDFFPDFDGHNHVEGTAPKEWVLERHLYHCMAFLCRAYNFTFSKYNVTAGSRVIVIQLREAVDTKREAKFELLYATPQRAYILKCNENSKEFLTDPAMGQGFYPDLFTLNMSYGSADARRVTFNMKFRLVETVFDFLQELKLCSYC